MSDQDRGNTPYRPGGVAGARDDTISLLDLIAVLAKRRWLIIGITGAAAALILLLLVASTFLPVTSRLNFFPNKYKPTATILLQSPSPANSIASLLSQTGLGSLLGQSMAPQPTNADLVTALLKTNSILDKVAQEFDFAGRYHLADLAKTKARQRITAAVSTRFTQASGMMTIGYEDSDREFATKVVNRLVDLVSAEFTRLSVSRILDQENDLSRKLAAAQADLAQASQKLLDFQTAHGVFNIDEQATANIQAIATLRSQLMSYQLSLESQSKYLPDTDYRIVQLNDEIQSTQKAIDELTSGTGVSRSGIVPQNKLMALSAQYQALFRDVTVQTAVVSAIKSQYEATRTDELTSAQAFQIVENAEVPEVRSSPHRSTTAIIVTVAAGFASILIAFIVEYFERARRDPVEAGKLEAIRESFGLQRKPPERRGRRQSE